MSSEDKIISSIENLRVYIDGRFVQIEKRLDNVEQEIGGIKQQLGAMSLQIHDNEREISRLNNSMHLGFAIMAVVVALLVLLSTYTLIFHIYHNSRKNFLTEDDVRNTVREEFARLKAELKL